MLFQMKEGGVLEQRFNVETHYQTDAYAPVPLAQLAPVVRLVAPAGWRKRIARLEVHAVQKDHGLCVPVSVLWDSFKRIPPMLEALINGQLLWSEDFHNLVVTVGLTDLIDKYFKGASYTAAHYIGLLSSTPTIVAGDTMASHSGWTEVVGYSQSTRVAPTWGTTASGSLDNSASKAVFSINATVTPGGAFLTTNSTKSGATGTLYGAGAFAEGNRSLVNGDTLNVQATVSATG